MVIFSPVFGADELRPSVHGTPVRDGGRPGHLEDAVIIDRELEQQHLAPIAGVDVAGDAVHIREGAFANMEGEVKEISAPKEAGETPKVSVEVSIFGRPVPVELEYWQVDYA